MFDLERIKQKSGLPSDDLTRLNAKIREDFGQDEMMYELHFLRALKALEQGWITLDDIEQEAEVGSLHFLFFNFQ